MGGVPLEGEEAGSTGPPPPVLQWLRAASTVCYTGAFLLLRQKGSSGRVLGACCKKPGRESRGREAGRGSPQNSEGHGTPPHMQSTMTTTNLNDVSEVGGEGYVEQSQAGWVCVGGGAAEPT